MASLSRTVDNSEQSTPSPNQETLSTLFVPKDTLDQPCDVILVAQDGEFKAHRQVLSEASPFFKNLLNSDMKESKEGEICLEMFTESVIRNALEFIYTGNVQILDEDDARDLVVIADYLFLKKLKTLAAQVLQQKLNTSNCISIFRFADQYDCADLISTTKNLILANFPAIFAASREDVLKMSNKEIAMWISSDELHISTEEDVFNIILAWIDCDKNDRKKYFAELFRHVRLVYISCDFLCNDVVTNDLVKDNEGCLDLATEAINLIVSKRFDNLHDKPRKSLESSVLVNYRGMERKYIMCYFPREDRWYTLGERPSESRNYDIFFCDGKLYSTTLTSAPPVTDHAHPKSWRMYVACYNPHSDAWMSLPSLENRRLWHLFVYDDEMYALFSKYDWVRQYGILRKTTDFLFTKYNIESNSWQDILSLPDYMESWRGDFCIVARDNLVYFIGGRKWFNRDLVSEVDRFDLSRNQWDKVADIQVARAKAHGAAVNGKIFIAGGVPECDYPCEMYNETTNEWQFVKSFSIKPEAFRGLVVVDDELYVLGETREWRNGKYFELLIVECYNADSNTWNLKTELRTTTHTPATCPQLYLIGGSIKVFKGFLSPSQNTSSHTGDKRKCSIM